MADTAPIFGWICTDPWLLATAEVMMDEKYEDASTKPGPANAYRLGRIGSLNVVASCLREPGGADAARVAQDMATSFTGIKAILITGFGDKVPSAGVEFGDLVISPAISQNDNGAEPRSTARPNIAQRALDVLQGEIGADGRWLSRNLSLVGPTFPDLPQFAQQPSSDLPDRPQLHYGNANSGSGDIQNEQLLGWLAAVKNITCFDTVAAGLMNLQIPAVVILGISNGADANENDVWKRYAAANAASYAKELIPLMTNNPMSSVSDLEGTEEIVPPCIDPRLPPFRPHQYPSHGNAVLLAIPTENESKKGLLKEAFRERAPNNVTVHTVTFSVDSGVGSQPYNEAGVIGAHGRISNALLRLDAAEYEEIFRLQRIGTVIIASIESYIQTENIDRPTDYGVVVIHNATTQQTTACTSRGVTVPPAYVNRARHFGFEGDPNRGRVTVGQILAAHVPGLDKANWQAALAGHSRYDLLRDAIRQIPIPW